MGWLLPIPNSQFVLVHGPLMVVGFLGTLIGLERAVALKRWWAYLIPISAALSALVALLGAPLQISASLAMLSQYTFDRCIHYALSSIPLGAFHHYGAKRSCLVRG